MLTVALNTLQLSLICHELWELYWKTVTMQQARAMAERVRGTGRKTDAVPKFAPFDLGINREFYEEFKDKDTHLLLMRDWFTYGDPPGFGANAIAESDGGEGS